MAIARSFILLLAAALAATPARAIVLEDDRAVAVSVVSRPARIAALSPHLVEIAYAAGAGSQLVAVARYSDYPEAARRLPRIGDASHLDLERMLAIRPDLVLAWKTGNRAHDLQRVERMGYAVFVTEPKRLADIPRIVRAVGVLAGTQAVANPAAGALERDLEALRLRYSKGRAVRVFYQIWHRPLLTVNGEHLISDVIALCGGRNVFAEASVLTPAVSLEAVVAARPEIILGGSSAASPADLARQWRNAPVALARALPVEHVPPDLIQRQTPRIVEGARRVCKRLDEVRRRWPVDRKS